MKAPEKRPTKKAAKKAAPKKTAPKKPDAKTLDAKKVPPKKLVAAAKKLLPKKLARSLTRDGTPGPDVLDRLFAVIVQRRRADPTQSHSARLLSRGMTKVAQKFGEEAVECLIEAVSRNPAALVAESADVLYHLMVMWVAAGVTPDQVWAELVRREGISGIEEKAARTKPVGTTKIP